MKRKVAVFVLSAVLITLCTQVVCMAFEPSGAFEIGVDDWKMPAGAVYLDLLLPLDETDECFVPFNRENGGKFGIAEDAEIVKYREDGYLSYTYHYKDAYAEPVPQYRINFYVEWEFHDANQELFAPLDPYRDKFPDNVAYYLFDAPFGSELEQATREACKAAKKFFPGSGWTQFCEWDLEKFNEIRKKCVKAKVAYLDKDGNVLAVSNAAKIRKGKFARGDWVTITLSGETLTTDFEFGPPFALFGTLILAGIAFLFFSVAIGIIIFVKYITGSRKGDRA